MEQATITPARSWSVSQEELTVFVRGRRCAMPLRNSRVCRFFCRGYFSASQAPISSTCSALSST